MRKVIPNIIDEAEAAQLPAGRVLLAGVTNPVVLKILDRLRQEGCFAVCGESYSRIETKCKGHPWHTDTGDTGHMLWCKFGCSMLMPGCEYEGGELKYENDGGAEVITNRRPLDMYVHTSDENHMVEPHTSGHRRVFLLFL